MKLDLLFVGFGVITTETIANLNKIYDKKYQIKIGIVEKDLKNVPGGIAYSLNKSKYGYFNNPLRLSPNRFINWFKKKKNKKKIINFVKSEKRDDLTNWYENYKKLFLNNKSSKELYLPRFVYSFYLHDLINQFFFLKKKNISIKIFKGNVTSIKQNTKNLVCFGSVFCECKFDNKNQNIKFKKTFKIKKKLIAKKIILGTGLMPPEKIEIKKKNQSKNYIWDFYGDGGTLNLIKKILMFKKKKIKIIFIGNKAGLLEPMQEIKKLIIDKKKDIKIISISKSLQTLNKAELSKDNLNIKMKFFKPKLSYKHYRAIDILNLLEKEFKYAVKKNYNEYDVWTHIMNNDLLSKFYNYLPNSEKKIYNDHVFKIIRSRTRYTYPETVVAKEKLFKMKKIIYIKDKVVSLIFNKKFITAKTKNNYRYIADIVVNVSGPDKINNKSQNSLIKSIKKISYSYNDRGFYADKNFQIARDLYAPGILSNNFNPSRKTIIKSISENSKFISKKLM